MTGCKGYMGGLPRRLRFLAMTLPYAQHLGGALELGAAWREISWTPALATAPPPLRHFSAAILPQLLIQRKAVQWAHRQKDGHVALFP